jgi:hypothetical protein
MLAAKKKKMHIIYNFSRAVAIIVQRRDGTAFNYATLDTLGKDSCYSSYNANKRVTKQTLKHHITLQSLGKVRQLCKIVRQAPWLSVQQRHRYSSGFLAS